MIDYRVDRIFWPDINNEIPDIVCALVKIFLGWNIHMIVVYLSGIWFFIGPTLYEETLGIGVFWPIWCLFFQDMAISLKIGPFTKIWGKMRHFFPPTPVTPCPCSLNNYAKRCRKWTSPKDLARLPEMPIRMRKPLPFQSKPTTPFREMNTFLQWPFISRVGWIYYVRFDLISIFEWL